MEWIAHQSLSLCISAAAAAEDVHQMGIEFKKDVDLPKWYQQVSLNESKRWF